MGTPPTETATGAARSAASPAAAGTRSPNPTQLAAAASASRTRIGILHFAGKPELVICSHRRSQSVTVAVILPSAAELVIIPTGLSRLAGQAIRLVPRL